MNNDSKKDKPKKEPGVKAKKRLPKFLLVLVIILGSISAVWISFSLIGRVNASSVIPSSAFRISVSNPIRLIDNILSHEVFAHRANDLSAIPELALTINMLQNNPLLKNGMVRFAARGNLEIAMLSSETDFDQAVFVAAWDMHLLSPALRLLPAVSRFAAIPNLYYVQAGRNSRFEFRLDDMTLFIAPYRNLIFITNDVSVFESRSAENTHNVFTTIRPSDHDAVFLISGEFVSSLLAEQDPEIAAVMSNIEFDDMVEAGLSFRQKKLQFNLAAPVSSGRHSLQHLLNQHSSIPDIADRIPADAQYATIISAGTLNELYQTALVFSPDLNDALRTADTASRRLLGLTIDDLLFSWTGNEFAVFGLEGRPHPVYAIQIADERRRQEIFDRAFRSIALREDLRLNLDGVRVPRIEVPDFLQSLLRRWDIFIPSPYYIIHRDFLLASESADALLAALRAMQRNEVLPRTAAWREIAEGRTVASAFSIYYSIDRSIPFFLRQNTSLSNFITLYRQGLLLMSFDRGAVSLSLSLIPGSGSGVTLVSGFPILAGNRPSNRVYGSASIFRGRDAGRIFFSSDDSAVSMNIAGESRSELSGQGVHWVIPAHGVGGNDSAYAWIVTDRGRVALADGNMEVEARFPIITGLRVSSPPVAWEGRLYLSDENGRIHVIDEHARQSVWETEFSVAVRSPPSFLTIPTGRGSSSIYAAVYPRTFFGEIWLLDENGRPFPNWPAPASINNDDDEDFITGLGFGSPLLFARNNRPHIAFVNQAGQLLVYNEHAALLANFPLMLDGIFHLQPVFDGEFFWLVSSNGTLFRVSLNGEVLSHHISDFTVIEEGYIALFDTDGDNIPEIFITGDGNALHGFTRNFRSLEGFPLPVWGKPLFIPAQGNRKAEIIGIGMDRNLYRWHFR